jgi:anti-sigma-K factor RskA
MPDPCERLPDYVLGALDAPARRAFEAHLAGCRACAAERDELRGVADALALGVPPRTPPAHLRERVLAEVQREAAILRAATAPEPAPRRRRRFVWPGLAVVGAAAGLALGVVFAGDPEAPTRTIPMAGAGAVGGTLELSGDEARLRVRGLPTPGPNRVYQVWVQRAGEAPQPTNALFDVARAGTGTVAVPARLHAGDAVIVTDEPGGGSSAPTGEAVLSVTV